MASDGVRLARAPGSPEGTQSASRFQDVLLSFASRALLSAPVMSFAVPGLLWAILARPRVRWIASRTVSLA